MIEKFRLGWRSNPQQQYNDLQKMVMHLTNIANGITDIDIKLNVLPQLITAINSQSLLLQAIADNTACACNALSSIDFHIVEMHEDMNNKLDYIAQLVTELEPAPPAPGPDPVPVYVFDVYTTFVDITPEMIDAGSFVLSGVSTKDGEIFDQLTLVDEYDFIDSVNVISDTEIEIQLDPAYDIPEGTLVIQVQQAESNIIQQFSIYYEAPPAPVSNFVRLDDDTIVPLTSSGDVSLLCSTSTFSASITLGSFTFTKSSVIEVCIVDGSLFVNNVVPPFFCYGFSSLEFLTIPDTITSISTCFLHTCTSFNQPLSLPSGLTSIDSDFLSGCTSFNSPLVLPDGLETIGSVFMYYCVSFSHSLFLPGSLTFVEDFFMFGCLSFTGPLNIGSLPASSFGLGMFESSSLSVPDAASVSYLNGVSVLGSNSNDFRARFPNSDIDPFRNLLPYGIVLTPNYLDFVSSVDSQSVKLTSTLPWFYARYWDDQGQAHEGVLPDWLQIDILNGPHGTFNLVFTVTENTGSTPRYASLDFSTGETTSGVVVEQEAAVVPLPLVVGVEGSFATTGESSQEYIIQVDSRVITQMDTTSTYQFNATDSGVTVYPPVFELSGTILVNTTRKAAVLDFDVAIQGYTVQGTQSASVPAKASGVMTGSNFHLTTVDNGALEVVFKVTGTISGNQITWTSCTLI